MIRADLEQARAALAALRDDDTALLRSGVPLADLFARRVACVDALLEAAWREHELDDRGAALLAVGGYGRGELFPHSDIDVLVLLDPAMADALAPRVERFIGALWDLGLNLGHSTRPLDACLSIAGEDVSIVTNLLEARFMIGERALWDELREGLGHIWPAQDFFLAKKAEQIARHRKYDHSGYKIEPNVKESPGGLRDWHMLRWLGYRVLGDANKETLVEQGLLTREEADDLERRVDFLGRVRYTLHTLTGRHEDRLLLIHQKALATEFGHAHADDAPNAAVEAFMQGYFRAVMAIERLTDLVIQQFDERLFPPTGDARALNPRFNVREGLIETQHAQIFMLAPWAMLEMFHLMQLHPEIHGIRASTLRQLRSHIQLMRDEARTNPLARTLFMDILRHGYGVNESLKRMNRIGLLAAYLPAFEQITGRMQFDLFHLYTVDEHTLFVIRNIRRFAIPAHKDESPLAHELFALFDKPELLILAALFHDIAKGRGGHHEELGAEDARAFCRLHGLPDEDTELVVWLVREHLSLSVTAQRRDIEDPEVVREFAAVVATRRRLDALYMLTVADIRGTNPTLWSEWRASLLRALYRKTRSVLDAEQAATDLATLRGQTLSLLAEKGFDPPKAARLWDSLPERHLQRHDAASLNWQMSAILRAQDWPLVMLRNDPERQATELFVCTPDQANIFARIAATLDRMGLDIQAAHISGTRDDMAVEDILFLDNQGQPLLDEWTQLELIRQIEETLSQPEDTPLQLGIRRVSPQLRHFDVPTVIVMDTARGGECTRVQLETGDRPGLLARVGLALAQSGVRLQGAVINTLGEKAIDTFFVSTRPQEGHTRALDETQRETLQQHLRAALANHTA
ncbi:MAG: [protein-PII] uridylyltransferase [Pseudomonadota bacterium]